jgi:hypothetical protein
MNSMTNLVASCARPRAFRAACHALALLSLIGCGARSSLLTSSLEGGDNGGEVDATGGFQSVGGSYVASAGGAGGSVMTGGYHNSGGSPSLAGGSAMTSGGYHSSGGSPGGAGGSVMASGGMHSSGGRSSAGGATAFSSGGHMSSGGTPLAKGGAGAGGTIAVGGSTHAGGSPATGGTAAVGTPTIDPDSGRTTIAAGNVTIIGYASGTAHGSGSWIRPTYNENSFCAVGEVEASPTYSSWAVGNLTVNQSSQDSGSTQPLVIDGSSIAVTYENGAGSPLEFQLWDGSQFWCYYLPAATNPTTVTIKLSELNTKCWDNTGTAFTPGTAIVSVSLSVPCSATTATPFDFCFLGMTVN